MKQLHLGILVLALWGVASLGETQDPTGVGPDGLPLPAVIKRDREPQWLIKVRLLPLVGGLASSAVTGNFDHGFGVDYERFLSTQTSIGLALLHNRLSIGAGSADSLGISDISFIEELQVGGYYTFYYTPFFKRSRTFLRVGFYLVFPSTTSPAFSAGDKNRYGNLGVKSFGARAALDYGTSFRVKEAFMMEFAIGISLFVNNPYDSNSGTGLKGTPLWLRNAIGGIGDIYPHATANFGFAFF